MFFYIFLISWEVNSIGSPAPSKFKLGNTDFSKAFKVNCDLSVIILIDVESNKEIVTFSSSNFLIISTKYFPGIKHDPSSSIHKSSHFSSSTLIDNSLFVVTKISLFSIAST